MSQKKRVFFSNDPPRVFPYVHGAAGTHLAMFSLLLEKLQMIRRSISTSIDVNKTVETHFAVSKIKVFVQIRCKQDRKYRGVEDD